MSKLGMCVVLRTTAQLGPDAPPLIFGPVAIFLFYGPPQRPFVCHMGASDVELGTPEAF